MERNHDQPPASSATQSSGLGTSGDESSLEDIRLRAEIFRHLLDDVRSGKISPRSFTQQLQEAGASPDEAKDYLEQLDQHLRRQQRSGSPEHPQNGSEARDESSLDPGQSADAVVWAQFQQKLSDITRGPNPEPADHSVGLGDLAKILELAKPRSSVIPPDVLAEAPHLQEYLKTTRAEGHLERTWTLRQAFATEKATDAIVDLMQRQTMPDPLPRSIWKDIILDRYVDFEKLYAGMDRGYDHDDEPKDFGGGYSIVKRDHFRARKPVQSESEWSRIARAWRQGVELLYPHRKAELTTYLEIIEELFRAAPRTPSIAICVDMEARDRYAKHPYRMDDRNQLHPSILAQMFRASAMPASSSSSTGQKRQRSPPSPPGKKPFVVCRNWNLGYCDGDECPFQRAHGVCYECGGNHRAKERDECFAKLKKRRRPSNQPRSSSGDQ